MPSPEPKEPFGTARPANLITVGTILLCAMFIGYAWFEESTKKPAAVIEPHQIEAHHSVDTRNFISNYDKTMQYADAILFGVCVPSVIILIYLLPWVVSIFNEHPSKTGIFVLNLLLGWTLLGWVIALVWAFTKPQTPQQVIVYQNTPAQAGSLDISHPSEGLSDDLHNKTG